MTTSQPCLRAVSDLHVSHEENSAQLDRIVPGHDGDWLIVAGDVAEGPEEVERALATLAARFERVLWVPGNHELWSRDEGDLRGVARYEALVRMCRALGVTTPEDGYPTWAAPDGPVTVVPMFLLYDYSFLAPGTRTAEESLAAAHASHIVCSDEFFIDPQPFSSRPDWCRARVSATRARLDALPAGTRTVLVNHWPLHRSLTARLRFQAFAQWCGTTATADWHLRYRALACVSGHLHIPATTRLDGVPCYEVSLGYPREWRRYGLRDELAVPVLGPGARC